MFYLIVTSQVIVSMYSTTVRDKTVLEIGGFILIMVYLRI